MMAERWARRTDLHGFNQRNTHNAHLKLHRGLHMYMLQCIVLQGATCSAFANYDQIIYPS